MATAHTKTHMLASITYRLFRKKSYAFSNKPAFSNKRGKTVFGTLFSKKRLKIEAATTLSFIVHRYKFATMDFQAYTLTHRPEWACLHAKAPEAQGRTPVHLCCLIDNSASMRQEDKLDNVKNSLHYLLDFLGPEDKVSLITFSSQAFLVMRQLAVTAEEKENIRARISVLREDNNTNLSAAIILARDTLLAEDVRGAVKQGILLLTDGHANMGVTRGEFLMEIVRNTMNQFPGTSISCIGYGTDHNVDLIQQISAVGGGAYYVVNNLDDVATVFGDVLGGLASCTLQQIRVLLPVNCELRTRYAVRSDREGTEVTIGDLPAGMSAVFLARIPAGTAVSAKAFCLTNLSTVEIAARVVRADDEERRVNGEAHYLRFEVLALLDRARELLPPRPEIDGVSVETEVNEVVGRIRAQILNITEYRQTHPHSLWDVLLDELQSAKRYLERRRQVAADTPRILSQHAAFLGCMRGISASSADPLESPAHPVLQSAFSNQLQRGISSQLHDVVRWSSSQAMMADDASASAAANPGGVSFAAAPLVFPSQPVDAFGDGDEEESQQPPSEPGAPMTPLRRA